MGCLQIHRAAQDLYIDAFLSLNLSDQMICIRYLVSVIFSYYGFEKLFPIVFVQLLGTYAGLA